MVWEGPNAEKIIIHFTPITSGIFPVGSFYSHLEEGENSFIISNRRKKMEKS